jgi:ABC-type polysaccharide/polyol phosphate export permease
VNRGGAGLLAESREVWRYRELLGILVERELAVRYKNSLFGVAWSLANPIVRAAILYVVFTVIIKNKTQDYFAYVLAAFFPWTYFLTGVLDAADSVSRHLPLVRKVYFPRELLPLATTLANLRHFLLTVVAVVLPLIVFVYARDSVRTYPLTHRLSLPPVTILLIPLLVVLQTLLIAGIALFLSALNVFFEDVKFLIAVLLDLLFYAVPIFYFLEHTVEYPWIHTLYLLNPMVVILTCWRSFLLHPAQLREDALSLPKYTWVNTGVPWPYFALMSVVCILTFLGGYAFFNSRKWRFVEQV